jgi:AbrB family looped-hinge helix DNA binding protein
METKSTSKGQVVIPASLRHKLGIKRGTRFAVYEEKGKIVLQPVTREYIHKLRGSLKGTGAMKVLIEERVRERRSEE